MLDRYHVVFSLSNCRHFNYLSPRLSATEVLIQPSNTYTHSVCNIVNDHGCLRISEGNCKRRCPNFLLFNLVGMYYTLVEVKIRIMQELHVQLLNALRKTLTRDERGKEDLE